MTVTANLIKEKNDGSLTSDMNIINCDRGDNVARISIAGGRILLQKTRDGGIELGGFGVKAEIKPGGSFLEIHHLIVEREGTTIMGEIRKGSHYTLVVGDEASRR